MDKSCSIAEVFILIFRILLKIFIMLMESVENFQKE